MMGNSSFAGGWHKWVSEKTGPAKVGWLQPNLVGSPKWFNHVLSVDRGLRVIGCSALVSGRRGWSGVASETVHEKTQPLNVGWAVNSLVGKPRNP
jgi:hypothetical protein